MRNKFIKLAVFVSLITIHVLYILEARNYIALELVFPVWLLSHANTFVSESQSMYPPALFSIVSNIYKFTNNLLLSIKIVQISIVIIIDMILFYYLNKKFGFKLAAIGLSLYIPWQVFFRGNYLWFDIATIPFLAISFIYFEKYIKGLETKHLLFSSLALSLGYFFKMTIFWVYALYLVWIVFMCFSKEFKVQKFVSSLVILFLPIVFAIPLNFLIVMSKGTFNFTFYWNIIMQIFVYPRLPSLSRFLTPGYYSVSILMVCIYIFSCFIIGKFSKIPGYTKLFLYSFTLVSLANIFPRWSDFRVQPFLVFLTIIFVYAIYTISTSKKLRNWIIIALFATFTFTTFLIFINRIRTEKKVPEFLSQSYVEKFTPEEKTNLINGKDIFLYDQPLYNLEPIASDKTLDMVGSINLALRDADIFYRTTSWRKALDYVSNRNPDLIIVPYNIYNRLISGFDLTNFEKHVIRYYQYHDTIENTFFIYAKKQQNL